MGFIKVKKDYLKRMYEELKTTGEFIFEADEGSLLYLDNPKDLIVELKPKKDPLSYKKFPDRITEKEKKKRWWKK